MLTGRVAWIAFGLGISLVGVPNRGRAAEDVDALRPSAERGYRVLTEKAFLAPDFDQEVFDNLWMIWEEPLRSRAENATPRERRAMAFSRYGFTELPGSEGQGALQYVDDGQGGWVMNCLACHGGKVAGRAIAGLPNSHYALETLTEEVRQTKIVLRKPLARMDVGSLFMPLGTSNGTTNSVMFGVALMAYRDADLNVHPDNPRPEMLHHDHDAPPWWHMRKKRRLYSDGFAQKGHRALMQFMMIPQNGPEKFREWEQDFRDVQAWMESLEPPPYPWNIDRPLAHQGEQVFNQSCARCHGTYGAAATYPEVIVPIEEIQTDRARLDALTVQQRQGYAASWFAHYGAQEIIVDPGGYAAPPLDGIWASAPYLHNGSVPTLWHLLHPDERPRVWLRTEDGYSQEHVGLEVSTFETLPDHVTTTAQRRRYFDTSRFSKSAAGHNFPDELDEDEKRAVLEYLKTL